MNSEIEDNIRKNIDWYHLTDKLKHILGNSSKEYEKHIVHFSIKNQLRFRGNLVRNVLRNEKSYYEKLIYYSQMNYMLFPYHLSDIVVKGLRLTPFSYYVSVLENLINNECSYDTLPNFTAVDCLRLLGIGRNEYLEIINKSKIMKSSFFGKKSTRDLLPTVPVEFLVEPSWIVQIGLIFEDDVKNLTKEEIEIIDRIIDSGPKETAEFNYNSLINLYKSGLIYYDVPISANDRVHLPPLNGFVMNRTSGDYFESLLYKIFVTIDHHMTVGELGDVLNVDYSLIKQAISLYCRLGIAKKILPASDNKRDVNANSCDNNNISDFTTLVNEELLAVATPTATIPPTAFPSVTKKIAFLYDSSLTAFLMMGNLSPNLKSHAVTMFEVGKIADECIGSLLDQLEKVSFLDADGEGEAKRFFDHAMLLRSTILTLKKLPSYSGLDLIRLESLNSLSCEIRERLLTKKYKLLVSMAPVFSEIRLVHDYSIPCLGPSLPEVNSIWFKLFLYHKTGYGPPSLFLTKGTKLKYLPEVFIGYGYLLISTWNHEPVVCKSTNFVHINTCLEYSPVLLQVYGEIIPAEIKLVPFPIADKEYSFWLQNNVVKHLMEVVDLNHNCGYFTMVDYGVKDFGFLNLCSESFPKKKNAKQERIETEESTIDETPIDDCIAMFSKLDCSRENKIEIDYLDGENWTLLDCKFGIPLFDVNTNTKICESIVMKNLTDPENLEKAATNNMEMENNLMTFISECQSIESDFEKQKSLSMLPKFNLIFKNGKINKWNGK